MADGLRTEAVVDLLMLHAKYSKGVNTSGEAWSGYSVRVVKGMVTGKDGVALRVKLTRYVDSLIQHQR
jgi:hypothetical protein